MHTYNNWGLALKELGKYTEALAKYQQAIKLDRTHVQVYNNWGLVLEAQGDLAGADRQVSTSGCFGSER